MEMVPSIVKNINIIDCYLLFYKNPFLQHVVFKIGCWKMTSVKLHFIIRLIEILSNLSSSMSMLKTPSRKLSKLNDLKI